MSSAIHLAGPDDQTRVVDLMSRYHQETAQDYDDDHRILVTRPLLDGSPLGAVWLIGPTRAPLGYVMVTFGWSMPHAGMVGWLSEIYIRPSVRRRGIGTETLNAISVTLRGAGVRAMHASLAVTHLEATKFCTRAGFVADPDHHVMTDRL